MDPTQEALLNEKCILVDDDDRIIGATTKKDCHTVQPNGDIKLHRAFSVFLFNSKGELLIQKRAQSKITYPNRYTNTCCSHPLSDVPGESVEKDGLGIRRAARRRLHYELGIPLEDLPLEKLFYLTRIHYKDQGDGTFGEHEIDYIIFVQGDVRLKPNLNEVSEIAYVKKEEFDEFVEKNKAFLTPWFHLILREDLKVWWNNLGRLEEFKNHQTITKLKF